MRLAGGLRIALGIALPGFATAGCAEPDPPPRESAKAGDDAVTLANGYKFVVRTSATEVVLKKNVDGRGLPFTTEQMVGKAILIHPVEGKSDGVYGRVLSVREETDEELTFAT